MKLYLRQILKQVQDDEAERVFFRFYHSTPNSSLREGFLSRRSLPAADRQSLY
ncbi:hypothetical protein [Pedobacter terrae]|uniref:hypothetical protein n=1 Tax=Pedobacter terrae TaxID=405671 RepID=UPI001428BDA5|nr:hypothetical protein [Pedobacter terrae]